MKLPYKLLLICLGALLIRLALLPFIQHPGIGDPNHYYNLALRLLEGHGFTIDYIWQYYNPPAGIVHPEDFWMPLTGVVAAGSMKLFGASVQTAVLPFVVLGALLPIVGYLAARQFGCGEGASLFAAAVVAVLPEYMLNSLRTDTTILNSLLVCSAILSLTYGLRSGRGWAFIVSGLCAGLAYLARGDNLLLLPMLIVTLAAYGLWGRALLAPRWGLVLLVPLIALLAAAPWLDRNIQVSGSPTTPNLDRMFFLTDFRDHYAYGREFNLQTLLQTQTIGQIITKRLFEMAASLKILYTALDVFLPVAVAGGFILLIAARDRRRWFTLAPTLILLGGMYLFYTLLLPIGNQGGSFKKSYLTLIPLLIPLAAWALEQVITQPRIRWGTMALVILFTGANGVELVRAEMRFVGNYLNYMSATAVAAQSLPDTNGDGEIILMAQDPFMLRFFSIRSVTIPMENRETVLAVAKRYHVDYLMMPPDRPALDPLYLGTEADPRFVEVRAVPQYAVKLYGFRDAP
jgi:4-amino-4-deoxy-L-arabinose transferase-like glycosyltransferase